MALKPNNHHKREQSKILFWKAEDRKNNSIEAHYKKGLYVSGRPRKEIQITRLRIQISWVLDKDEA